MERKNLKTILSGVGFYSALALCLGVIGVGGYLLLFEPTDKEAEPTPTPALQAEVTVPNPQPVEIDLTPPVVETISLS